MEKIADYNTYILYMKMDLSIDMTYPKNYKKVDLYIYQRHIKKLIYLSCSTRPNIAFVIK